MIMRYRNARRHEIKWKNNAHLVFDNYAISHMFLNRL